MGELRKYGHQLYDEMCSYLECHIMRFNYTGDTLRIDQDTFIIDLIL